MSHLRDASVSSALPTEGTTDEMGTVDPVQVLQQAASLAGVSYPTPAQQALARLAEGDDAIVGDEQYVQAHPSKETAATAREINSRKRRTGSDRPFPMPRKRPVISEPNAPKIPRTRFAPEYKSTFLKLLHHKDVDLLPMLSHVNCSYLTPKHGNPPSLFDLKKHAQGLTVLIRSLTVTTHRGQVDNANIAPATDEEGRPLATPEAWEDEESFDWLNDLRHAYQTDAPSHKFPITTIVNNLKEVGNHVWEWCPLHRQYDDGENRPEHFGKKLPHDRMSNLVAHANECLEILDHNLQATGGVLSLLPPEDYNKQAYKDASNTLLGQMILFTQRLTRRVHELEIQCANAADVLAGEASIPAQAMAALGPNGRFERDKIWPQDRFVLANSGEDVWQYINRELLKAEVQAEKKAQMYRQQGVIGERHWMTNDGGDEYERGITYIDVQTRYFRANGEETIFVVPAHAIHPNTEVTREMEAQPQVVQVVKPEWPERTSDWEKRNARAMEAGRVAQRDLVQRTRERDSALQDIELLRSQEREHQRLFAEMEGRMKRAEEAVKEGAAERLVIAQEELQDSQKKAHEIILRQTRVAQQEAQLARDKDLLSQERIKFEETARNLRIGLTARSEAIIRAAAQRQGQVIDDEVMAKLLESYRRADYMSLELRRVIHAYVEEQSLPLYESGRLPAESLRHFKDQIDTIINDASQRGGVWNSHQIHDGNEATRLIQDALKERHAQRLQEEYNRGRQQALKEIDEKVDDADLKIQTDLGRNQEQNIRQFQRTQAAISFSEKAKIDTWNKRVDWMGLSMSKLRERYLKLVFKMGSPETWNYDTAQRKHQLDQVFFHRVLDIFAEYDAPNGIWSTLKKGGYERARIGARYGIEPGNSPGDLERPEDDESHALDDEADGPIRVKGRGKGTGSVTPVNLVMSTDKDTNTVSASVSSPVPVKGGKQVSRGDGISTTNWALRGRRPDAPSESDDSGSVMSISPERNNDPTTVSRSSQDEPFGELE